RIVVSVPIETGPTLVAKQCVRALAGRRGLGDYAHRERYSLVEMLRGVAGLAVPRVVYEGDGPTGAFAYYGHKGFAWRQVQRDLAQRLVIERRTFSPLPWAGPALNSQVWFICRPRV